MKLISLNTWGGRVKEPLEKFLKKHSDADICLFQEVQRADFGDSELPVDGYSMNPRLLDDLSKHLPTHSVHFCPVVRGAYGIAAYTAEGVEIGETGEALVTQRDWYDKSDPLNRGHNRKIQWFEARFNGKRVLIVNAHLTHRPSGKGDSAERLRQSRIIVDLLSMFDCPKILAGDFNLLPDTESIRMIEAAGMRNLVREYGVTSTRTELYKKPLRFADYVFVSPEIKVKDFKVLPDIVSDHAPLCLDFDL